MGHIATPWQVEAANYIVGLLGTPTKEYAVLNAPPGVGKSTLMTLDIPAWLVCRDRAIRGATFSNTQHAANRYVQRLKRFLERTTAIKGDPAQVTKGLALDADATVADDYGTFRPTQRENWSQEQFVVAQLGGVLIDEKEPTWSAFGRDSEYIGMRLDYLVADDFVDKRSTRTLEAVEKVRTDWNDVAERRLDPGACSCSRASGSGPGTCTATAPTRWATRTDTEDGEAGRAHVPPHGVEGPLRRALPGRRHPPPDGTPLPRGLPAWTPAGSRGGR